MTNWTKEPKNVVTFTKEALLNVSKSFLLMEDGFRLLNEDLTRILLEIGGFWTKEPKPTNASLYLFQDSSFFLFQTQDFFALAISQIANLVREVKTTVAFIKEPKPTAVAYFAFQDESVFTFQEGSLYPIIEGLSPIWAKEPKV